MITLFKVILYLTQAVAVMAALRHYSYIQKGNFKNITFYMVFIVVLEILANYFQGKGMSSARFYNLYDIVTYAIFVFWFYQILIKKRIVLAIALFQLCGLIFSMVYESFFINYWLVHTFTGTMSILILVFMFYTDLLIENKVHKFLKLPEFWIATGLLIFNIGYLPILFLVESPIVHDPTLVQFVLTLLNIIMYGCFTYAFICSRRAQTYFI